MRPIFGQQRGDFDGSWPEIREHRHYLRWHRSEQITHQWASVSCEQIFCAGIMEIRLRSVADKLVGRRGVRPPCEQLRRLPTLARSPSAAAETGDPWAVVVFLSAFSALVRWDSALGASGLSWAAAGICDPTVDACRRPENDHRSVPGRVDHSPLKVLQGL